MSCEAMLKELELFNQEKRRIRDHFTCKHFIKVLTRDDYLVSIHFKEKWV